ncbi:Cation transporter, partial [Pseudomonas syringae pv. tagetis]
MNGRRRGRFALRQTTHSATSCHKYEIAPCHHAAFASPPGPGRTWTAMNHSIAHHHQDSDLFGLLYGFRFRHGESGQEIGSAAALDYLQNPPEENDFIWLHLNLSHAACERWMKARLDLPEEFFEALHEGSRSTRIEHVDATLLAVVNDVVFDFNRLSTDISTLWVCARQRLLITARLQP